MEKTTQITLPIPPEMFWGLLTMGGLVLAVLVIFGLLIPAGSRHVAPLERLKERMGMAGLNGGLFLIGMLLWGAIFLLLVAGLLAMISDVIWRMTSPSTIAEWDWRFKLAKLTALTAVLGAVVALPFTLIRIGLTRRQTETAAEGLITDRINKAVAGLGAEKTVSRVWRNVTYVLDGVTHTEFEGREDRAEIPEGATDITYERWEVANRTMPNLEVRIGAIYALERIAQDSDRDHVQIMEILCTYIRQNAPADLATPFPPEWLVALRASALDQEMRRRVREIDIRTWISSLAKPREDVQVALTVIGRRKPKQIALEGHRDADGEWQGYRLDLRETCLQRAYLSEFNFDYGRFDRTLFQGADLTKVRMQGAGLFEAPMQGANLRKAQMQRADLRVAQMQGAELHGAKMQWADLTVAQMQRADFRGAQMQVANLENTDMRGADLSGAQMQGAFFNGAEMDAGTRLGGANLRGAGIWHVDCSQVSLSRDQIDSLFIGGSVTLPEALADFVDPPKFDDDDNEFETYWRAWQKKIGFDPEDPSTW